MACKLRIGGGHIFGLSAVLYPALSIGRGGFSVSRGVLSLRRRVGVGRGTLGLGRRGGLHGVYPVIIFKSATGNRGRVCITCVSRPDFPRFDGFVTTSGGSRMVTVHALTHSYFISKSGRLISSRSLFLFNLVKRLSRLVAAHRDILMGLWTNK